MAYFFDWGIRMLVFNIVLLVLVFFLVKNINELLRSKRRDATKSKWKADSSWMDHDKTGLHCNSRWYEESDDSFKD